MKWHFAIACLACLIAAWGCGPKPETEAPGEPPTTEGMTEGGSAAIESARIDEEAGPMDKPIYATVDGEEIKVADNARKMWLSEDMKTLYFSYHHGRSGFEAEGEGLKRWQPGMDEPELVFDDDEMIVDVKEEKSAEGKTALLVHLENGGAGGSTAVVADPELGRVFRSTNAMIESLGDGMIKISNYNIDELMNYNEGGQMPEPTGTSEYSLDELLTMDASREIINPWPPEGE